MGYIWDIYIWDIYIYIISGLFILRPVEMLADTEWISAIVQRERLVSGQ